MTKRIVLSVLSVLFLFTLVAGVSAITAQIGNSRAVLYPTVGFFGTSIDRTIWVNNTNDSPINVTIKAMDENSSKMVEVIDKSFVLQPGESKDARFKIKIQKAGEYDVKLGVFFPPTSGKGAGSALLAEYIIHAKKAGDNSDSGSGDPGNADNSSNPVVGNSSLGGGGDGGNGSKVSMGAIVILISTLVLAGVLVWLMFLLKKRKNKKIKKRTDRSS